MSKREALSLLWYGESVYNYCTVILKAFYSHPFYELWKVSGNVYVYFLFEVSEIEMII